jgi:cation:H+ antiporter
MALWRLGLLLAGGLALLVAGAEMLVRGAVVIAEDFRVSDAVIGLTVVAVGTSLPELATSLTAALKGKADIAIGNVVGSNIFNILGILGVTALVTPVPVAARFLSVDLWVLLAASGALAALLLLRGGLGRLSGAVFLTGYAGYTLAMY